MTHGVQILIVDDQARARQSLRALLTTWPPAGEITEASSGQQAVRLVEQEKPELVFMDICMPGMDGLQATRLVKARWPEIQVVVLTLYGEYESEALAAGADAFAGKGDSPEQLLAALDSLIGEAPRLSGAGAPLGRTVRGG